MNPAKDVYKIYVKKCKGYKKKPIDKKEFYELWEYAKNRLIHMIKNESATEPFIAMEIDDTFTLYEEVNNKKLVTNIWTKLEAGFLLGGSGG